MIHIPFMGTETTERTWRVRWKGYRIFFRFSQWDYSCFPRFALQYRYQCCGSGSGIRCFFDPWTGGFFTDPGTRIPELGSWLGNPDFRELSDILGKMDYISLSSGLKFSGSQLILHFLWRLWLEKKVKTTNFFPAPFVVVVGSGIRQTGSGID